MGIGVDGCQENAYSPVREQLATGGGCKSKFFPPLTHVQQHTELNTRLGAAGISYATEAFLIMVKTLHLQ